MSQEVTAHCLMEMDGADPACSKAPTDPAVPFGAIQGAPPVSGANSAS